MNKNLDYEIYSSHDVMLAWELEPAPLRQKQVLHSRILKLSAAESNDSYGQLGYSLSRSGQLSKSLLPLKKSVAIHPEVTKVQIELANVLLKLERVDECLDSLKKAFPFSPDMSPLHMTLIEALEKKNMLEKLDDFNKEIAKMITDPKAIQEFYIMNAEILILKKKYPQGLISYKRAVETNPTMEEYYHYNYGLALYHEGEFEEAIVQFEHAWRLDPNEKETFNDIVHLNYCLGQFEKALEGFEYVIENKLVVCYTYSHHLLMLYHLDQDEQTISKYKGLLQPYIQSDWQELSYIYQEELRITQVILERDDIDEKAREFNSKKIKGINLVLSFINEEHKYDLVDDDF